MTIMTPSIKTDTYFVLSRRGPTLTKYVAAIDGVWLLRKDGVIRKFSTRHAARMAAITEINKASA
jgi:hypothetical protein